MNRSLISAEQIGTWAKSIAYQLDEPAVVSLNEMTATVNDWSTDDLKCCMMAGVEYSAIVANLGMMILTNEINDTPGLMCERAYFPEKKLYTRLLKKQYPIFSKETFHSLKDFEVLMFSSYFPVQYFNLPKMLEMTSIPAFEKDRDGLNSPLVIAGGINTFNPEPIADFVDAVFLGEGEGKLTQVLQICKECRIYSAEGKLIGIDKDKALHRMAAETDFMYIPKFYAPEYYAKLGVKKMTVLDPVATLEPTRALCNLFATKPLVNAFVPVCDSADMSVGAVEVSRGCSASCNFCEGSARTMPLRERSLSEIFKAFDEVKRNTGCYTSIPYGFNLSDHTNIRSILKYMLAGKDNHVQMSSQRIDLFTYDLAAMARATGTSSLTLAIESGSEKGRRAINKNLTVPQIMETFEIAYSLHYLKIKVYMIANPPFETQTDIDGLPTQLHLGTDTIEMGNGLKLKASDTEEINAYLSTLGTNHTWDKFENLNGYKITYEDGTSEIVYAEQMLYRRNSPSAQEIAVQAATLSVGDTVTTRPFAY